MHWGWGGEGGYSAAGCWTNQAPPPPVGSEEVAKPQSALLVQSPQCFQRQPTHLLWYCITSQHSTTHHITSQHITP